MINVGERNKGFLIAALRKNFEEQIVSILKSKYFGHNFTLDDPYFQMELAVSADAFEVAVLRDEVEILKKQLERSKKKNVEEEDDRSMAALIETTDHFFGGIK